LRRDYLGCGGLNKESYASCRYVCLIGSA